MANATTTEKPNRRGLLRLWRAWNFSLAGLKAAWRHEAAFRQELFLFFVLAPVGLWLGETAGERAMLLGSLFLVLMVELLNSAVEAAVDRLGPDYHPLAGRAKDLGSAAVLVALVNALCIWLLIFFS